MKKTKKTALTAAAFAAAMGVSACPVNPAINADAFNYLDKRMENAGDVNGDDDLNLVDVVFLYRYLKNQQPMTDDQYYRADVNEDGYVNIYDFIMQKQLLLFYPEKPPVPQPDYGPEWWESDTTETETETELIPQPVYGPPPVWETDTTEITETTPETVYGPPVWIDPDEQETEPTETEYQPESDIPVEVYGPPEYFGITENPEE